MGMSGLGRCMYRDKCPCLRYEFEGDEFEGDCRVCGHSPCFHVHPDSSPVRRQRVGLEALSHGFGQIVVGGGRGLWRLIKSMSVFIRDHP